MQYHEVLKYLYESLPVFHRIGPAALKPGLNNIIEFCQYLGNPQKKFSTVHIAGTNGKGSSSHMLAAILQTAGYKTGLYTSPHLKSFTERIKIDGVDIDEAFVVSFVLQHKAFMEQLKPSFFEVTVGMAFQYFATHNIEIAIVETGLGGRLDSTNIIHPLVSLITNISFDHQGILGDTLPKIAYEKAGIIKAQVPVVIGETQEEVKEVFLQKAKDTCSEILFADQKYRAEVKSSNFNSLVLDIYHTERLEWSNLIMGLVGEYQIKNILGVLSVIDLLNRSGFSISHNQVRQGLMDTVALTGLKGRWQLINNTPLTICDTGHNTAGIQFIVEQIRKIRYGQLYWVFGVVNDKDLQPVLALLPKDAYYVFCQAAIPRALEAETLAAKATDYGLKGHVLKDVNRALQWATAKAGKDDLILVGGSTFVVAEIDGL